MPGRRNRKENVAMRIGLGCIADILDNPCIVAFKSPSKIVKILPQAGNESGIIPFPMLLIN